MATRHLAGDYPAAGITRNSSAPRLLARRRLVRSDQRKTSGERNN